MSDRALRPLALGDIFDEGFDLYKRNFLLFLLITAVWIIPLYIIQALALARLGHPLFSLDFSHDVDSGDMMMDAFEQIGALVLLSPVSVSIMWIALSMAASQRYLNRPATLGSVYRSAFTRILPALAGAAILGLSYAAGVALCGIGVLWPAVVFLFAGQTFSVEHKSAVGALKRSNNLVSGDSGKVFGALLLFIGFGFLLKIGFGASVNYLLSLLFHFLPGSSDLTSSMLLASAPGKRDKIIDDLALGITQLVLIPFAASVVTVLYFDFRVRKEAFDVELLAEDLGYPPLDVSTVGSQGYMPPVMPAGVGGRAPIGGWTPPPASPGWGQAGQPPPPGWGQPGQPPPGWGQPGQPPMGQGPSAGWGQPGRPAPPYPGQAAPQTPPYPGQPAPQAPPYPGQPGQTPPGWWQPGQVKTPAWAQQPPPPGTVPGGTQPHAGMPPAPGAGPGGTPPPAQGAAPGWGQPSAGAPPASEQWGGPASPGPSTPPPGSAAAPDETGGAG